MIQAIENQKTNDMHYQIAKAVADEAAYKASEARLYGKRALWISLVALLLAAISLFR